MPAVVSQFRQEFLDAGEDEKLTGLTIFGEETHTIEELAAALPIARDLGVDPALLTCGAENTVSRRVVESNGGVLEDQRGGELRFWVPTIA